MKKAQKNHTIKFNISKDEIKEIFKDYEFNTSDILQYDDETKQLLDSFNSNLTQPEKIIMELYAEFQSQRKVATLLNVSRTTIVKELNKIREKILYDTN